MLIDSSQHAYRKKRSIGTALIDLINNIKKFLWKQKNMYPIPGPKQGF